MKTLFILRHAKSSWDYPELTDFERPLNKRGKKAAIFMGKLMAEKNLLPELIMSSPAERAKQTAKRAAEAGDFETEIQFDDRIYGASANSLLFIVSEFDDKFDSAMIVGHNPGFESLAAILSNEYHRMTTANLAVIDLEIDSWSKIEANCGNLRELFRPKEQMKLKKKD